MSTLAEVVDRAVHVAKTLKEDLVAAHGPGSDLATQLALFHEGVLLGIVMLDGDRDVMLQQVVQAVALTNADQASHVVEAYMGRGVEMPEGMTPEEAIADPDRLMPNYRHGDMQARFAAGDRDITELIHVMSTARSLETELRALPYHYDEARVVWDGEWSQPEALAGTIPRAMRLGFEAQAKRQGPALNVAAVVEMIGARLGIMPMPVATPPRNEPCPCGSGQKAKRCCWAPS